jgi:phosphate transporter family protein
MGIISALLVGSGYLRLKENGDLPVPLWIVLAAYSAIALGTLAGGWRIVKTLGQRITALQPVGGFSAETAAASSLYLATALGIPVSTTHTITGAIVGVGATRRLSAVRWGVAGRDRLRDHRLPVRAGRPGGRGRGGGGRPAGRPPDADAPPTRRRRASLTTCARPRGAWPPCCGSPTAWTPTCSTGARPPPAARGHRGGVAGTVARYRCAVATTR